MSAPPSWAPAAIAAADPVAPIDAPHATDRVLVSWAAGAASGIAGVAGFDNGAGATVGVEEQYGSTATQISYNQPTLSASTAYRCTTDGFSPVDTTAPTAVPVSATVPAPQTLGSTATVHLTWASSADASGIVGYDLQFSKLGGAWTNVVLGSPTATSVDFGVTPGKGYAFRLRAHDGVGNVGAWASSAVRLNLLQEGAAAVTTLDLCSPTLKTKRVVWTAARGGGSHTLEIRQTGTCNAASTSDRVDIDAFLVQP